MADPIAVQILNNLKGSTELEQIGMVSLPKHHADNFKAICEKHQIAKAELLRQAVIDFLSRLPSNI